MNVMFLIACAFLAGVICCLLLRFRKATLPRPNASIIERFDSRHIAERKKLARLIESLTEISSLHGDAFFRALIQETVSILAMRFAFVAECVEGVRTRVRTLAYWRAGEFIDNFEFAVEGTPCKDVNLTMRLGEGIAGNAFLIGTPINVHDVNADSRYVPTDTSMPLRSLMASPIQHEEHRWGTLSVQSAAPHAFSDDDERLLNTLAMQAALAIEHAHLHEGLKKALEQEKAMREQAIQSAKLVAMGRLLASVAHELNNPLQAIQNALFLVKQDADLHLQTRQDIEAASAEAESMAELIGRLREAYRLTPGDHIQPESITTILQDVLRLIGTYLRHSEIAFEFESDPALPLVLCNRNQLRQVFLNLCLNAVEAMKSGGKLTIRTSYKPQRAQVLIAISDTGIGINPSALSNIFEPFFTTKENGTGLGLSIVYEIVQNHNGKIEVESKAGVGTTFNVWLPVGKNL